MERTSAASVARGPPLALSAQELVHQLIGAVKGLVATKGGELGAGGDGKDGAPDLLGEAFRPVVRPLGHRGRLEALEAAMALLIGADATCCHQRARDPGSSGDGAGLGSFRRWWPFRAVCVFGGSTTPPGRPVAMPPAASTVPPNAVGISSAARCGVRRPYG